MNVLIDKFELAKNIANMNQVFINPNDLTQLWVVDDFSPYAAEDSIIFLLKTKFASAKFNH